MTYRKKLIEVALPLGAIKAPEQYILVIVEVKDGKADAPHYVRQQFARYPDFGVTGVNYNMRELLELSEEPT